VEVVLFIGIQASGKSSFYAERFLDTHLRLNMDLLRTRTREAILLRAFIEAKASFVVDNTNPTRAERTRYIQPARDAHYRIVGYYFSTALAEAIERNAARSGRSRVPDKGVRGTYARLELPAWDEGFDELFYVRLAEGGGFAVEAWKE
jgi:predicted kinase